VPGVVGCSNEHMDAAELRARQAPLKDQYRTEPQTATTPLRASATFADPGVTATVETWASARACGCRP
jgi:hypothetical protein